MMRRQAITLTCFFSIVAAVPAADLAAINRTIAKEPAYKGQPKYCLLVFGPEAKARVWLVQDGDTLYVDRNGNGDLTEKGKQVTLRQGEQTFRTFEVGEVRVGGLTHKELSVTQ